MTVTPASVLKPVCSWYEALAGAADVGPVVTLYRMGLAVLHGGSVDMRREGGIWCLEAAAAEGMTEALAVLVQRGKSGDLDVRRQAIWGMSGNIKRAKPAGDYPLRSTELLFLTPRSAIDKKTLFNLQSDLAAATSDFKYPKISMGKFYREPENDLQFNLTKSLIRFFWNSPIPKFYMNRYFREPLLLAEHLTIRFHKPGDDSTNVKWHLDGNFYGFTVPLITAWMPLVEVGEHAPGLEFAVPTREIDDPEMQILWKKGIATRRNRGDVNDEELENLLGCEFRKHAVIMNLGDLCLFDQFMLHRTQVLQNATHARTAIEFRVTDRNFLPPDIEQFKSRGMLVSWKDRDKQEPSIGFLHNLFPHILTKPT